MSTPDCVPVTVGMDPVGCCAATVEDPGRYSSNADAQTKSTATPSHFVLRIIRLSSTKDERANQAGQSRAAQRR